MAGSRRVARLQARRKVTSEAKAAIAATAAGYVRVSTEEQASQGYGLESQARAIKAFAVSQGYELVKIAADPAVSGATRPSERAGFAELVELAASGAFSVLLVWKFDRLARQIVYSVVAANELSEKYDVVLRSVTEPIDTSTPMGRTIFAVLAGMAEQEREAITERTWHGRREKGLRGGYACGGVPIGYDPDADGNLVINESEARVVRNIFALRKGGATYDQIARALNKAGSTTKRGNIWRKGGVAHVLDNPIYTGSIEYLFKRFGAAEHVLTPGMHEPIINSKGS